MTDDLALLRISRLRTGANDCTSIRIGTGGIEAHRFLPEATVTTDDAAGQEQHHCLLVVMHLQRGFRRQPVGKRVHRDRLARSAAATSASGIAQARIATERSR